ncbi:MAG: xanthine dehydrogenase family protein molybdopterin-binding subunit [Geminicoccaceae bacterium]|nr:xanthine dehydrogenase family protein molybdopterin-binding subunit [Geminicoccaceae bacterium]
MPIATISDLLKTVESNDLIGRAVPRLEDERLLRGEGRYTADFDWPDQGHAVFVRSDVARGIIRSVSTDAIGDVPGLRLVATCMDDAVLALNPFPALGEMPGQRTRQRPVMARGEVCHVGEILAMVVADDLETARDVAALVEVEIDALPGLVDFRKAPDDDTVYLWQHGDMARLEAGMAAARWRVRISTPSQRLVVHPLEPRAALARVDADSGHMELLTCSQGAHKQLEMLAPVFGIERDGLTVRTPDVGGAFGIKLQAYPEQALCLLGAKLTGRPVKWVGERREAALMDAHGRAQWLEAEIGLDEEGRFIALHVDNVADMGAYTAGFAVFTPSTSGTKVLGHTYAFDALAARVRAVYSNTVPVDAYRGAGKPEIVYAVERVIDEAARVSGIDPIELRRRNLVQQDSLPRTMPMGQVLESGDFPALFETALEVADFAGFSARRDASLKAGLLRGIGIGMHMHCSGGFANERSVLEVHADGRIILLTGTQAGGQGHATVFAQIVAGRLGIDPSRVVVRQGDTSILADGGGTGGSSSLTIAGHNIVRTTEMLLDEAREQAAAALEAAAVDLTFEAARFTVAGTDRSITLFELADRVELSTGCDYSGPNATFPNGCYVAEVEVDPETGAVALQRFGGVDDIGRVLNPLIGSGQIHGGIAQGAGQALLEEAIYDEAGQLLNGTFMDYAMPRADNVPMFDCHFAPSPTGMNPLGAKGAGELSPTGAMAPVVHAVLDALAPLGVRSIDMPMTPHRIWEAIRTVRS